jgi:predicted ATPase/class 3 adenylate cyclase
MTFDDVLTQVRALLQWEKRVSYRALKVRFQLDDDLLEAVKDELIYAKHLAMDEEHRVLVWTGPVEESTATPAPPLQLIESTPTHAVPAVQPTSPILSARPPDAERRQLTVMFCDLVASTKLASQLDPEDWRDVVRAYHTACTEVIQRSEGYIAQLLGDGLLVYFGYPQVHEDDAHRSVRTALGILAAMDALNRRLQDAKGLQLAIRIGIHTGLVVVGAMGSGNRQEQLALGETPNIAARIQGLAASNTVAISAMTYRLVQGYFQCQDLGAQELRGVMESMRVYHVLGASGATSRLDVAQPRGLTPLVGRESEVTLLLERWEQVKAGHGQVVLLTGEAGIGKSRLVQVLKDHIANEPQVRWECRSAEYAQNTALFPLTDLFQRTLQWQPDATPDEKLRKLEHALSQYRLPLEDSVPLFAPLLSLSLPASRYAPLPLSPQRQRQKTLETIVAILLELAERQPVLVILEDLHWTDPTTLALLHLVIDQIPTASLLVLLTCRPHFQPAWQHRSYLTEMTLDYLSHTQVAQIVHRLTEGKALPIEVLAQIVTKTDGVPLFVEELTKAILESGQLTAVDGHYTLTGSFAPLAIPATLQDSLMARLDRLVTAKAVAQYAAVIGRQFPYELLQAASQLDEVTLQRELGRLVEAELLYQRGVPPQATFTFKHALIQDAAYASLLKSTRQQYHQRLAQVLEAQFPETAEAEPELLAQHYTAAGLSAQAVGSWQRAGQQAIERSAHVEAIRHLTRGLEVLTTLPETPARMQQEIDFQVALGPALIATKGWVAPEVEQTYTRARALSQQVEAAPQRFPVLWGLWVFYHGRGASQAARELGEQLLSLAHRAHDRALVLQAHHALGPTCLQLGELPQARAHFEHGIALYDPAQHRAQAFVYGGHDPGICCRAQGAVALWLLGYPDQAVQWSQEALTQARELAHPFSLANALEFASYLHQLRREGHQTQAHSETLMLLAREQGFAARVTKAQIARGWALAAQGCGAEGVALIRQGLDAERATGAAKGRAYYLALLAEAAATAGDAEEGLRAVADALEAMQQTRERHHAAELHRLKGELRLIRSTEPHAEAEACFQQAFDIARRQEAKSLELRAAMSLSRLWQQQGKQAEAHELLASVYSWFTEGFDTADLQEARALLEELGS